MQTNYATLDDDIGTRDWEGPIPGVTPCSRMRPSKRGRARARLDSAMKQLATALRARPLMTIGAAFGAGVIVASALRGGTGRVLLLAMARKLTL